MLCKKRSSVFHLILFIITSAFSLGRKKDVRVCTPVFEIPKKKCHLIRHFCVGQKAEVKEPKHDMGELLCKENTYLLLLVFGKEVVFYFLFSYFAVF